MRADIMKAGLSALYYSGAHRLLAPYAQGIGLIFTLHHVVADDGRDFAPNGILKVTPDFLQSVIDQVRAAGLDMVSLDEARERILAGGGARRFVCFTLDDGYRDNLEFAWPIFKAHGVPIAIFVPSDYPEGRGELWWVALEEVIRRNDAVAALDRPGEAALPARTMSEKQAAFQRLYWWLRTVGEDEQRAAIARLCAAHGVDAGAPGRALIMSWEELAALSDDPLVTIGAHTVGHYALAKLPAERARAEMARGAEEIARKLGLRPRHLSYPYGDPGSAGPREFAIAAELGFATAVTTRKGVLFAEHRDHLTALPRISLNGAYQAPRFTELYLTGAPFALWNRFRKVSAV